MNLQKDSYTINLFQFNIVDENKDLMIPTEFEKVKAYINSKNEIPAISNEKKDKKIKTKRQGYKFDYIRMWNTRTLGIIEDVSGLSSESLNTVLTFGTKRIKTINNNIKETIGYMGENYFLAYLLREYLRAIYHIFFDLSPHSVDKNPCVFNKTKYSSDIKKAFKKENCFCPTCKDKINTLRREVSWTKAKTEAAKIILEIAERESAKL